VHQRWLFILVPGYKSFAFDYLTLRHIDFPKLPIISRQQTTSDCKIIVLNERDLVVVNPTRNKKTDEHTEMLIMDLHSLKCWQCIKLREDMRANCLVNFAVIPFKKPH